MMWISKNFLMKRAIYVHIIFLLIIDFFLLLNISCKAQFSKSGIVTLGKWQLNNRTKEYELILHMKPRFYWYNDSLVIEEVLKSVTSSNNGVETGFNYEVVVYYFIDLRNKSIYEYPTFSAGSMFKRKYKMTDSTKLEYGWSFFSVPKETFQDNFELLPDTMISGIKYKRAKSFTLDKIKRVDTIIYTNYFREDKKGSFFDIDKTAGQKLQIHYPLVLMEIFSPKENFKEKIEINFLPRNLNNEELKVFAAWKKNAKLFPVSN